MARVGCLAAEALLAVEQGRGGGIQQEIVGKILAAYAGLIALALRVFLLGESPVADPHLAAADGVAGMAEAGEFRYANELVEFIRAETGDWFSIEVAAYPEWHPQARSPKDDLEAFARKVKAGANSAITQYFFNADAYARFVDDAQRLGVGIPVVPGIMPILNATQLMRFSDATGAEIPRWIRLRLQAFGDDTASIRAFGLDVVTRLCEQLRSLGAPGLHFYTMNQSAATLEICRRLGI